MKVRDWVKKFFSYLILSTMILNQLVPVNAAETNGDLQSSQVTVDVRVDWVDDAWKDSDDNSTNRPDSINIHIHNGDDTIDAEVKASDNWTYTTTVDNDNGLSIDEDVPDQYEYSGYTTEKTDTGILFVLNNAFIPKTTSVTVSKTWDDEDHPKQLIITLTGSDGSTYDYTLSDDAGWSHTFENLPYWKDGQVIEYTSKESLTDDEKDKWVLEDGEWTSSESKEVEEHNPNMNYVTIKGTKTWVDDDDEANRPLSITVDLYANNEPAKDAAGNEIKQTISADNGWSYKFAGLNETDDNGVINYTVREDSTPDNYIVKYDGYNIINIYKDATISISGKKTWDDNNDQDGKRPESNKVYVVDSEGNQVGDKKTVTANDDWSYTFENLPKYNDNGDEIKYSIAEDNIDGYTTEISDYNITNKHTPSTLTVTVNKTWDDSSNADDSRPEKINFDLYADTEKIDTQTFDVDKTSDISIYTFKDEGGAAKNYPVYKDGTKINYSIKEEDTDGYTSTIEKSDQSTENNIIYDVNNKHGVETVKVCGKKVWVDGNNTDEKRPTTVTINLLRDGTKISSVKVGSDNTFDFGELPANYAGKKATYSITENDIDNYKSAIVKNDDGTYTVTNTYVEPLKVKKVWDDVSNKDGKRPDGIEFKLSVNNVIGAKTYTMSKPDIELAGNNSWGTITLKDDDNKIEYFPVYDTDGNKIEYSVKETNIDGYKAIVNTEGNVITIRNQHETSDGTVKIRKIWNDCDNHCNSRPNSIEIQAYTSSDDSEKYGDPVKITKAELVDKNVWEYTFNLNNENDVINHFKEIEVPKYYDVEYTGWDDDHKVYTITDNINPSKVPIYVRKYWNTDEKYEPRKKDDASDELKATNDSVTIEFDYRKNADSEYKHYSYKLTPDTNWTRLVDTDEVQIVCKDGQPYIDVANIKEAEEDILKKAGYKITTYTSCDLKQGAEGGGFYITVENKYKETVDINVKKIYKSVGSTYPTATFTLTADGKVVDSFVYTGSDSRSYTFKDLPKYNANGKEIVYDVNESCVDIVSTMLNNTGKLQSTYTTYKERNGNTFTFKNIQNCWLQFQKVFLARYTVDKPTAVVFTVYHYDNGSKKVDGNVTINTSGNGNIFYNKDHLLNLPTFDKDLNPIIYYVSEQPVNKWYLDGSNPSDSDPYTVLEPLRGLSRYISLTNVSDVCNVTGYQLTVYKVWDDDHNVAGTRPESMNVNYKYKNLYYDGYTDYEDKVYKRNSTYSSGVEAVKYHFDVNVDASDLWVYNGRFGASTNYLMIPDVNEEVPDGYILDKKMYRVQFRPRSTFRGSNGNYYYRDIYYEDINIAQEAINAGIGLADVRVECLLINKPIKNSTHVHISKSWNTDNKNKIPESIGVSFIDSAGNIKKHIVLSKDSNFAYDFYTSNEDYNKYKSYNIIEDSNNDGIEDKPDGFKYVTYHLEDDPDKSSYNTKHDLYYYITNSDTKAEITDIRVTVNKTWDDDNNRDGYRPKKFQVSLQDLDGHSIASSYDYAVRDASYNLHVNSSKSGFNVVEDYATSDKYTTTKNIKANKDADGNIISYTVDLKNTHIPEKIDIHVIKHWSDKDIIKTNKESKTVRLYADGKYVKDGKFTYSEETGEWAVDFNDLYKYQDGKKINYTVVEDGASHVNKTLTKTIVNHKTITFPVKKEWIDDSNVGLVRPTSVTVGLFREDQENPIATVELSDTNNWEYEFTKDSSGNALLKYDNGNKIKYYARELDSKGKSIEDGAINERYKTTYSEDSKVITNSLVGNIKVTKVWDDNNDENKERPTSVNINLKSGNDTVDSIKLNSDNWSGEFKNIPIVDENNKLIKYTVTEDALSNSKYELKQTTGDSINGFTVENGYKVIKEDISGEKTWDDFDDYDKIRPSEIAVYLYKVAGDSKIEVAHQVVKPNKDGKWLYDFGEQPVYENGKEITYKIEDSVDGYECHASKGYDIVNKHTPEHKDTNINNKVTVIKIDEDNDVITSKAQFGLYEDKDCNNKIYEFGTENGKFNISTDEPVLLKYLPESEGKENTLYLKEIVAPKGYDINSTVFEVKLGISKDTTDKFNTKLNHLITINGSSELRVVDKKHIEPTKPATKPATNNSTEQAKPATNDSNDNVSYAYYTPSVTKTVNGLKPGANKFTFVLTDNSGKELDRATNDENGIVKFKTINYSNYNVGSKYTYKIHEIIPDGTNGYDNHTYVINVTPKWSDSGTFMIETSTDGYSNFNNVIQIDPQFKSVTVQKIWNDNNDQYKQRPEEVKVQLYANGQPCGDTIYLNDDNNWQFTWPSIPSNDLVGTPYNYTVAEIDVPKYYDSDVTGDATSGFVVTNTFDTDTYLMSNESNNTDNPNGSGTNDNTINLTDSDTGDSSKLVDETIILIVALAALACVLFYKRKHK